MSISTRVADGASRGRRCATIATEYAGMESMKIMKRAGHADFATTQIYINLAGETFPEAAELFEERMFGQKLGQKPTSDD